MKLIEAKRIAETLTIIHDFTYKFNDDYPFDAILFELNSNFKDFIWTWNKYKVAFDVKEKKKKEKTFFLE